ncbi:MAG: glycine oxidase ThiO [Chloroflexi bacterium]|nr:glycine oxidase ThiO [Chloroflexota bacterium]
MVSLTVNGKPRELERETSLPQLLRLLDVDVRLVAVAVNGEVVPRRQHEGVVLRDGDEVEIVRMVGGGSAGDPRPATRDLRPGGAEGGAEVVIAGAGIIGCAIAYELSRRGVSCLLLDGRRLGMAATNAAAGILAPLAEFRRPDTLVNFGLASLRLYPAWVQRLREEVPDIDVEFALDGVLRVAFDEEELTELRAGLRYRGELGLVELDRALVREVEPRLASDVAGGLLCPQEGQVGNQLFTLALSRAAQRRGARVVEGCPVLGFRTSGGRVAAVRTPQGEFACDHLVLATGPWTRPLAGKLGVEVPSRPVRGQMLALGRMVTPIRHVIWGKRGYLVPRANGLVFAGATVEKVGFRIRTTKRGLTQVRQAAFELVPQLRHAREHFSWAGLRPDSPDGLPILGPLPGWANVTVATGHFRNGILLAPITGELIAEAIVDARTPEALSPFSPARFAG